MPHNAPRVVASSSDGIPNPMARGGDVHIGISGWRYKGWRGHFYPPQLRQHDELKFTAERFNSIEINGTHYSLQRPSKLRAMAR